MKASKQGSLAALAVILFAVIMALLFFSCEKIEDDPITTGNVTFWTTEDSGSTYWDTGWILYVDDVKFILRFLPRHIIAVALS